MKTNRKKQRKPILVCMVLCLLISIGMVSEVPSAQVAGKAGDEIWEENIQVQMGALAGSSVRIECSGTCGEGLTWALDAAGILTISGSGEMENYTYEEDAPWADQRENIVSLILGENVTSVGDYAFFECENLKKMELPDALKTIGCASFAYCSNLDTVVLPEQLNGLGDMAFFECSSLSSIDFPAGINYVGDYLFYQIASQS